VKGACARCGGEIHYIEYTQFNGHEDAVLDAWWAHAVHPSDNHDAVPTLEGPSDAQKGV
jgi:hypothetical protein